jgi:hypothetical protein
VDDARAQLERHRADSALVLLDAAVDPVNGATPAVHVYAQLVRGFAWREAGNDSLAGVTFDRALADYRELKGRGVDFAPMLRSLADSVQATRHVAARAARLTRRRE